MVGIVTVCFWLAHCWFMVGRMLVHGWQNVGSWLAECGFTVGRMLLYG